MDSSSSTFGSLLDDLSNLGLSDKDVGDRLIIALDFGTTYSGIAYALTTDPEKVFTIDSWPGGDRNAPKTPTALQYGSDSVTNFKWGYELDRLEGEKIQHIKLLLDPEQPRPYFIPTNIEVEKAKLPKPVVDVASDYMRAIFEHAIEEIKGQFLVPELLHTFDKRYVLTVPAIWSDKAKDMTSRAAEKAGISPVDMITEPEAAALFTLKDLKSKGLKVNDAVVICDAGGGTVDLISYEILSLAPFELRAITKASGAVAGSSMIDRNLEEEIRKVVGDEAFVSLKKTEGYQNALKEFAIAIKPGFRGKDDRDKYLSFPMAKLEDNPANGLVKNSMTLSGATMFRLFDPIVREVDRLVGEQISAVKIERLQASPPNPNGVKAIFLVGGFGSSDYLAKAIQNSNPGVTVIQPKEAWSSISRGAVLSKLPMSAPIVVATKAAKHYGTIALTAWDPTRDTGFPKLRNRWTSQDECDIMDWFIRMDDELNRGEKITLSFKRKFPGHKPRGETLRVQDDLYESTALPVPEHPVNIILNCVLHTDLNDVPRRLFKKKRRASDGEPYCQLSYDLQVENTESGLLKYSLLIEGEEHSAVETSY
ncbi:uncharacterized protein Z519_05949 [Cladophialophora bantiana CBS 173.52]|uniref:Hsp70-like protein n=1 Tax=Cladophialophora bantiana (strain ATCC 10958 / CBS 173.52 / CDC B-1940 / NIH 8579) TaxID=1442370 RepID=A0A0D2I989_CLAB1|nr:uncharacterized protein Z519_05949 [Cladophialophora bantiana CBS 173.52]KIW93344.1 hypothetical protein Z519_05949 [Cladophialophora bantiana CBS 173.52]